MNYEDLKTDYDYMRYYLERIGNGYDSESGIINNHETVLERLISKCEEFEEKIKELEDKLNRE